MSNKTVQEHMARLLGHEVQDAVTKIKGICTSVSFDLYGCVMAYVRVQLPSKGATQEDFDKGAWMDEKRLTVLSKRPVMPQPEFVTARGPVPVPGPERKAPHSDRR